nr:hypothetical protein [candidate division Zixibacteria bacterium]
MTDQAQNGGQGKLLWLIYTSLLLSGIILLADALNINFLARLSMRLGLGLVFSAMALIIGKNKPSGIIATAIIWVAILITVFS